MRSIGKARLRLGRDVSHSDYIGWLVARAANVQCDELWSFIQKKEKRCKPGDDPNCGELIHNFALGKRNKATTDIFIESLRLATSGKFQITTDGFPPYVKAISDTLEDRASYAQTIKIYRASQEGEARYSPAEVASVEAVPVMGQPDPERICTSHIERQNLSIRMGTRRFTRLTNAFSKKWENHWAALACWFAFYNFCRRHQTLRMTPAMAAGISDHIWSVRELLEAA